MEGTEAQGMPFPTSRVDFVIGERRGVEIDYCPRTVTAQQARLLDSLAASARPTHSRVCQLTAECQLRFATVSAIDDASPDASSEEDIVERTEVQGMVCPICRIDLVMGDRQGVEIDYCPKCRGVWLGRGELDKIVEKALAAAQPTQQPQAASFLPQGNPAQAPWGANAQSQPAYAQGYDQHDSRRHDDHDDDHHGRRNRGGWLSGLMD